MKLIDETYLRYEWHVRVNTRAYISICFSFLQLAKRSHFTSGYYEWSIKQLQVHGGVTNPSLIWTTQMLLQNPHLPHHSLLSLYASSSSIFSPNSPHPSPFPPSSRPRCCLKSIPSLFRPQDKTEGVQGVIRKSSRGGLALVRLLSLTHTNARFATGPLRWGPRGSGAISVWACVYVWEGQCQYPLLYLLRLKLTIFSAFCC